MSHATWLCGGALGLCLWAGIGSLLAADEAGGGRLDAHDEEGESLGDCPLKHTDVQVDIAGFVARVTVTQKFHNPFKERIEAIYTFPLSQNAAVDRMEMRVGTRTIKALIMERDEARRTYEQARDDGHLASLLDQERPNIFTQAVANIQPGDAVDVTLSYVETLDWREGVYHFDFPTVIGPRYTPTDNVPDADRITPRVADATTRTGHDLSISVKLDAALPIRALSSEQHEIDVVYADAAKTQATVALRDLKTIPNRDFVLTWQTAGDEIADSVLTHTDARGKFFTLVLQPPARVKPEVVVPRELIFVVDNSGSMSGRPLDTARKAMRRCIEELRAEDTFNLITFSGSVAFCFDRPRLNTAANREQALKFLETLQGSGGTEMMKAIHACLGGQSDERLRIVCFMTDGFVGNDMEIIDAVKQHAGVARVFSFGIGTSVNRFLLDGIARAGRGEVQYVLGDKQATESAERFAERVHTPVLTDIELAFAGVEVEQVYPTQVGDLFSAQPLVIQGRYLKAGKGNVTLRGKTGAGEFSRQIDVDFPEEQPQHDALAPLWARARVEELMNQDLASVQSGNVDAAVKRDIVTLGLDYQLLTQFTSFVAVEASMHRVDGPPKKVGVAVELPEGVSREGVFGGLSVAKQKEIDGLMQKIAKLDQQRNLVRERLANAVTNEEVGGVNSKLESSPLTIVGSHVGMSGDWNSRRAPTGKATMLASAFGSRGSGSGSVLMAAGGTSSSEGSVAQGLQWMSRHQAADGYWSFAHEALCKDKTCTCSGTWKADTAATALCLLSFYAAGQTHESKGPYQRPIVAGVDWLIKQQKASGDLSGGDTEQPLLAHAVAMFALCEAYAMTNDDRLGVVAQSAIRFSEIQQNSDGGWAAKPGGRSSTEVVGWQILALRSGQLTHLKIEPKTLQRCKDYLRKCQTSTPGQFAESPGGDATPASTAAGLLAAYLLGAKSTSPVMIAGVKELQAYPPSADARDTGYWFFATQVLRRHSPEAWQAWNQQTRRLLVEAQQKEGCAKGSWNPEKPTVDEQGRPRGRLYVTGLSALTLEDYYRYLPIYKVEEQR